MKRGFTEMDRKIRLLVCGGRALDSAAVFNWLERYARDAIQEKLGRSCEVGVLIHGGARGADEGAAEWGRSEGARVLEFKANWRKFGKRAGPIRNQRMLDEGSPDLVIAFPGGRGTADMVKRATEAGCRVYTVESVLAAPQ